MQPAGLIILALVIVGLVVGSVLAWPALFLTIPLLMLFGWLAVGKEAVARQKRIWQMKRFRREARTRKVDFDEDDKKTIAY